MRSVDHLPHCSREHRQHPRPTSALLIGAGAALTALAIASFIPVRRVEAPVAVEAAARA
ncbi:MAG TPA: hypothetical protein VIH10_11455 [Kribbella sp.]|jgi:hypothetical protein